MGSEMGRETSEIEIRQMMVDVCRRLYGRNMLAAADGNISYRLRDNYVLFTPSGRQKAFIEAGDIAVATADGHVFSGQPSGEKLMHLEIYRLCREAKTIIHAHPPHAVAFSLARPELKELPNDHLSETILGAGSIPIVPYARPTTDEMGIKLRPFLPQHRAMILARHGAVCWGETLEEALNGIERIEHSAQILWLAEQLGGSKPMPKDEVQFLEQMRSKMGDRLL
jgi:L-fuculose-phosphate aldolase